MSLDGIDYQAIIPGVRFNYTCLFVGWTLSYALYGVTCGQTALYFRTYTRDLKRLKAFVTLIILLETAQSVLLIPALWYYLITRGVAGPDLFTFLFCEQRLSIAFGLPTEAACFLVESFFLMRMWQFIPRKWLILSAALPFLAGWGFNIVYLKGLWQVRCYPDMNVSLRWVYPSYGFRIISDGIMAGIMCYILYRNRPSPERRTKTLRLVRSLIMFTVANGLLMWLSSIAFVLTYKFRPDTRLSLGIYLVRGRLYANTMLTLLNYRERHRNMAIGTMLLDTLDLGTRSAAPPVSDIQNGNQEREPNTSRIENIAIPPMTAGETSTISSRHTNKSIPVHCHPPELYSMTDGTRSK